jgi:hypothetical protein
MPEREVTRLRGYSPQNCRWADSATQHANRHCMMTSEKLEACKRAVATESQLSEDDALGAGYGENVF